MQARSGDEGWIAGVLALEPAHGQAPAMRTLPAEAMAGLADHVASDLARLLPGIESLGLALAGALFDQAQLLRPGWPAFACLAELHARRLRGADPAAILAFGSSAGTMVDPALEPDPAAGDGSLLLLPFVLRGDPVLRAAVGERMERELEERGLAAAATALYLEEALSLRVEHARYLSRDDLCALCALQLEHAGLGHAWQLLESALFTPGAALEAVAPTGQRIRFDDTRVELDLLDAEAWRRGPGHALPPAELARGFLDWQREQRRVCALFAAHGLRAGYRHADSGEGVAPDQAWWIRQGAAAPEDSTACVLFAHTAPDLGVVAITAAAQDGGKWLPVACGYPLLPRGPEELRRAMAARYGCAATPRMVPLAFSAAGEGLLLPE